MSLTFTITHQKEYRKVTCERSSTVAHLLGSALQKFKLPPSTNGTLLYSGKRLDPSSPIRFTNLVNNGKITLEVSSLQTDVNLKVIASILGESSTHILKLKSTTLLPDFVAQFCAKSGVSWSPSAKVCLSVLHNVIDNFSPTFGDTTVSSIVGHVPSAVVRLSVEERGAEKDNDKDAKVLKKTDMALNSGSTTGSHEKLMKGNEGDGYEERASDMNRGDDLTSSSDSKSKEGLDFSSVNSKSNEGLDLSNPKSKEDLDSPSVTVNLKEDLDLSNQKSKGDLDLPLEKTLPKDSHPSKTETIAIPAPITQKSEDVVYVPSSGIQAYENPDEDYELTSTQAEKYYNILKSMQARPKTKKPVFVPSNYTIRLRFPDRVLLDLHFDDPAVKLGQVLKKIDSYITESYVNSYKIKSSSPPFKEIPTSFAFNNTPLKELPEFQSEKVLLIWEPVSPAGNYLKQGIAKKDVAELPTVKLESNRGNLADDSPAPKKKTTKGMPKWFKPGR